jgi:hypothetical protein
MLSSNLKISRFEDHPKNLTVRVNEIAENLDRVAFSEEVNDLSSGRILTMPQIWECLRAGEVQTHGLEIEDDEVRGIIAHHSHEGLVQLSFALIRDTPWIEVLSASIEVK